mmetsp:Transcript_17407/g.31375  ORF Transcript_17407/g.31375 Transcript_17407/m.31375 type:complete len:86 (+) Transcript_17407:1497-1754(+)
MRPTGYRRPQLPSAIYHPGIIQGFWMALQTSMLSSTTMLLWLAMRWSLNDMAITKEEYAAIDARTDGHDATFLRGVTLLIQPAVV